MMDTPSDDPPTTNAMFQVKQPKTPLHSDSLADACKLAWHTFYGMQRAYEDFENLRFEVWTIAISLDSLHSLGTTSLLVDRQPDRSRWALSFSRIIDVLFAALRPLHRLVILYLASPPPDRVTVRSWLTNPEVRSNGSTVQDFRRKLSMLVESLNVFLSCLTHAELARVRTTSETEEYKVLARISKNIVDKWQRPDESEQQEQQQQQQQPPLRPRPLNASERQDPPPAGLPAQKNEAGVQHHPTGVMNLDDLEDGFRNHINAMCRIRNLLRRQQLTGQPNPTRETIDARTPPVSPSTWTAILTKDGGRNGSKLTSIHDILLEDSKQQGNRERGPPAANDESSAPVADPELDSRPRSSEDSLEQARKRKRVSKEMAKTEDDRSSGHHDTDWLHESLNGFQSSKGALEELLTAVIVFDQ